MSNPAQAKHSAKLSAKGPADHFRIVILRVF